MQHMSHPRRYAKAPVAVKKKMPRVMPRHSPMMAQPPMQPSMPMPMPQPDEPEMGNGPDEMEPGGPPPKGLGALQRLKQILQRRG